MAQNSKWFENDIKLPLTSSQRKLVEEWLPKFIEARRNHFGRPELAEGNLEIGAPDLIDFISFVGQSVESEFDLASLKKSFVARVEEFLVNNPTSDQKQHYQLIVNHLKDLKPECRNATISTDRFRNRTSELN